jgi:hypothetical protein
MNAYPKSSFPRGHNRPPSKPSGDDWTELSNAFITVMIGAFAAVGAMAIGTLF